MKAHPCCGDFLAHHTEYVDGRMGAADAVRWSEHVERCPGCARYDRVVREGGELLRSLGTETVSEEFAFGLRHRLQHVREEERERVYGSGASAAAALLLAGVLAAIAWSPLLKELGPRSRPGGTSAVTDAAAQPADRASSALAEVDGLAPPDAGADAGVDIHRSVRPLLSRTPGRPPEVVWIEAPGRPPTPLFLGAGDGYLDRPGPFSPLVIAAPAFHLTSSVPSVSTR